MMKTTTYLLVPAVTDVGSQMRIVKRHDFVGNALESYRATPDLWAEVGLINSRGAISCLDAPIDIFRDMADCLPACGGTSFTYDGGNY